MQSHSHPCYVTRVLQCSEVELQGCLFECNNVKFPVVTKRTTLTCPRQQSGAKCCPCPACSPHADRWMDRQRAEGCSGTTMGQHPMGWYRDARWLGFPLPRQHTHPAEGMVHGQPCSVTSPEVLPMPKCPPCFTCNPWFSQVEAGMPAGAGGSSEGLWFAAERAERSGSQPSCCCSSLSHSQGWDAVPTQLRAQQRFPGSASPSSQPFLGTQLHSRTISLQIFQIAR